MLLSVGQPSNMDFTLKVLRARYPVGSGVQFEFDTRMNILMVIGASPEQLQEIETVVKHFEPLSQPGG